MKPESHIRIFCRGPFDSQVADRIEAALSDPASTALFIEFHGRPGADEAEVDQILNQDPLIDRLRKLIRQMEQGPKAVAALVYGSIGGLQFELALGCHARFASDGASKLDFPWLKYGLMPVLGATQRLPRLCGIEWAGRLLLEAEKVNVSEVAASGLFEVANRNLFEIAAEWAVANPQPVQPWDRGPQELSPTYSQRLANRQLLEKIYLKLRRRVSPEEAAPTAILKCLQDGLERSMDAGIRLEGEQWSAVRRSRSTTNRVRTLHGIRQRAIHRVANQDVSIRRIGVLGAGLMGTGIAYTAARAGYEVLVVDISPEASERSLQRMKKIAQQDACSGFLKQETSTDLLNRVSWSSEMVGFAHCDFIVEAVFERADLKKAQIAKIATLVAPSTIIASNTTTIPISDLALACHHPERFIGTHFFAPVNRMELLEIVVGEKTSPEAIDRAVFLATGLAKTPIVVRDGPGFFTSRVVAAYLQEALFMMLEGISPWMIDNVAQNAGMILGPLTVIDLMSLDLLADIFESLAKHGRGAAREAPDSLKILREFIARSRLGRKTGAGIYEYNSHQERVDSALPRDLFSPVPDQTTPEEIEQRLFAIQTIEAQHAIREGIIEDAGMADLASVLGWSYPAARGGVLNYPDFIGAEEFAQSQLHLQEKFGSRFALPRMLNI
jgi:3-hydroxyacyl-CoA dehydrogenase / enoyl-CoA hydratase / 3-hydroxybutyryl-CoA epimerase